MAENWGERLAQVGRNLNPVTRVRNMFSGLRDHPMQTIGTGLLTLLGGAVAGPIGAQIGRAGSQYAFNQYNQSQAPDALPGITSPNTFNGQAQPNIGTMLGIPNYAGGNVGSTGANQYLTGNFGQQPQSASPGFQPINMDYGQNQQAPTPQSPNGGLPGITSANPYPQSGPAQSWHDSQGYDTGWRTGEGGTGLGGGWSTVDTGAEMSALSQLLSNAGGTLGDAARFNMTPEFGTEIMRADGTVRQRGGDSRLIERTGSNRPTTAQEFIRRNPDRWSQMLQQMRQGAGRG
jgi:hypothetical protein